MEIEAREVSQGQLLHLERAEESLFNRFCVEVDGGQYGKAAELVTLMQRLSLV